MKKENLTLNSLCDGLLLNVMMYVPEGEIKGIVQFSHGMAEHQTHYYGVMEYLTQKGYVTIINDHRGHGKSVKSNDDLGYFYEEKADYIIEDLHQITMYAKERFPEKKVTLLGHSMGSLIVRKYIKKYDQDIDALIVCGSPSINPASKMGRVAAKTVKKLKGERYRSKLLNALALTNDTSSSWLSYDENYVKEFNEDPLCGYIFTANGFINLTCLMVDVYDKKGWELHNPNLPIFFIAGADDMVIKNEKQWLRSIEFLKDRGYTKIQKKLYPHMKHVILREEKKEIVYQDILEFIEKA